MKLGVALYSKHIFEQKIIGVCLKVMSVNPNRNLVFVRANYKCNQNIQARSFCIVEKDRHIVASQQQRN